MMKVKLVKFARFVLVVFFIKVLLFLISQRLICYV